MKKQAILVILFVALATAACGGQTSQPAPQPAEQQTDVELPEAAPAEAAPAESQPVEQSTSASGMLAYEATKGLFKLSIPASWAMQTDNHSIENTVVETATSPDGNAFVQVLTNRVGYALDKVLKGQVTLDYMKRLYGKDLRVATDVTLADGREKLEWWSETNETSGTTYFNMGNKYLYYYTVGYKDAFKGDYASTLKEVADSFSY